MTRNLREKLARSFLGDVVYSSRGFVKLYGLLRNLFGTDVVTPKVESSKSNFYGLCTNAQCALHAVTPSPEHLFQFSEGPVFLLLPSCLCFSTTISSICC